MNIKQTWQRSVDLYGEDFACIMRIGCYLVSIWYGLMAVLSPFSEYCYIGPRKFYLMWQKLCFGAGAAGVSFGFYKLGQSYRTTSQRNRL